MTSSIPNDVAVKFRAGKELKTRVAKLNATKLKKWRMFVESTVNGIVSKRLAARQQMRRTPTMTVDEVFGGTRK